MKYRWRAYHEARRAQDARARARRRPKGGLRRRATRRAAGMLCCTDDACAGAARGLAACGARLARWGRCGGERLKASRVAGALRFVGRKLLFASTLDQKTLDDLRTEFGDEVGFYYSWVSFYTRWLLYLSPFAVAVLACEGALMTGIVESQGMKIVRFCWMVAILLWGSLFDVYWRQREAALRARCP